MDFSLILCGEKNFYRTAIEKNKSSQQNIGKRLAAAKEKLVRMYLGRVSSLIICEQNKRNNRP